jgi:hypothetical protein
MNVFQRIYDWLRALKTPKWIDEMFEYMLNNIIFPALSQLKEEALTDLQQYIIEASKLDVASWPDRFNYVKEKFTFKWAAKLSLSDKDIIWIIQLVYSELKKKGFLD